MNTILSTIFGITSIITTPFITPKAPIIQTFSIKPLSASVSVTAVRKDYSSAAALQAGSVIIDWKTNNYPTKTGVDIHLIKKVSDSPLAYNFVQNIAENTSNDGRETWVPNTKENNLYVEVTCAKASLLKDACAVNAVPVKI